MTTCPPSLPARNASHIEAGGRSAVSRREQSTDTPQQYIKGYTEFYKLRFKVTPDVLIPRPETELLVDEVLRFIQNKDLRIKNKGFQSLIHNSKFLILDIGTGAGAIAISVAKNLNHHLPTLHLPTLGVGTRTIQIIATDVSAKALKIAKQNAKLHGVEKQITFIQADLLNVIARSENDEAISKTKQSLRSDDLRLPRPFGARNDDNIDILVTNLPYIPSYRIPYLDSSVKDFEPHVALDGGEDGFELYRKHFQQISDLATQHRGLPPMLIIGEIDYTHGELAVIEAQKYFPNSKAEVKTDLAHKQRILLISID
ncbi:MAG: peptide chain release factor N(5)-glutamine methyltransferase [Candidatus Daviesbacteria bacterium]|nr:peptide chain release factor N(5)-glutamine methyltransferase [Candidatus Daviesbacteria bacterium]